MIIPAGPDDSADGLVELLLTGLDRCHDPAITLRLELALIATGLHDADEEDGEQAACDEDSGDEIEDQHGDPPSGWPGSGSPEG